MPRATSGSRGAGPAIWPEHWYQTRPTKRRSTSTTNSRAMLFGVAPPGQLELHGKNRRGASSSANPGRAKSGTTRYRLVAVMRDYSRPISWVFDAPRRNRPAWEDIQTSTSGRTQTRLRAKYYLPVLLIGLTQFVSGCASMIAPSKKGTYAPVIVESSISLPVQIRSVRLLSASLEEVDGVFKAVPLSSTETKRVEAELKRSITIDLDKGGVFRRPHPGESAYVLDVEFSHIDIPQLEAPSVLAQTFDSLLLGLPLLFGVPQATLRMEGDAVFHLFAADGCTPVHETVASLDKKYRVGLYYGVSKTLGDAASLMVLQFKQEVKARQGEILDGERIVPIAQLMEPPRRPMPPPPAPTPAVTPVRPGPAELGEARVWLFSVGISDFANADYNLEFADSDAQRFHQVVLDRDNKWIPSDGDVLLLNSQATRAKILHELTQVIRRAAPQDIIIVFLATHGLPDPDTDELSFFAHDTDANNLIATGLSQTDIARAFTNSRAGKVVLIVDACHSGELGNDGLIAKRGLAISRVNQLLSRLAEAEDGMAILTASTAAEESLEEGRWAGGVFTHFVVRGLAGEADRDQDGIVSLRELFDFTYSGVTAATEGRQHPELKGRFDNDLPLAPSRHIMDGQR